MREIEHGVSAPPTISVIIPVYNTEKYLHRCIDSVLAQTYQDFELLLIDDGSKDSSGTICDEYAAKDTRVRVFHKENGGVSSARNVGLDNAQGEWITFVDSDDEALSCALETLIRGTKTSKKIDFVSAGYECYEFDGRVFSTLKEEIIEQILDLNQALFVIYRDVFYQFYVFTKLFRRRVIECGNLRFDEAIFYSEDRLFIINYLCAMMGDMYYTTKPIYKYIMRQTGAMMSLEVKFDYKLVSGFYAALKMFSLVEASKANIEIKKIASCDVIDSYIVTRMKIFKFRVRDKLLVHKLKTEIKNILSRKRYVKVQLKLYVNFTCLFLKESIKRFI